MRNGNLLLLACALCLLSSEIYAGEPIETIQKYLEETLKENYLGVRPIDSTRLMKKYLPSFEFFMVTIRNPGCVIEGPCSREDILAVKDPATMEFLHDGGDFFANNLGPINSREAALDIVFLYIDLWKYDLVRSPRGIDYVCRTTLSIQPKERQVEPPRVVYKKEIGFIATAYVVSERSTCVLSKIQFTFSKSGTIKNNSEYICARIEILYV